MSKYRVQASDILTEQFATVVNISGARMTELSDGLPHIRIEPRVGPGLAITNVTTNVGGYANTEVSRLDLKIKPAGTQSLSMTTTVGGTTGTVSSTTNLKVGMAVSGNANVPAGTLITAILSDTTIQLSAAATAAGSAATTFTASSAIGYTASGELELKLKTTGGLEVTTDGELQVSSTFTGGSLQTFSPATTTKLPQFYLDGTTLKLTDSVVTGSATGISVGGTFAATGASTLAGTTATSLTVTGATSLSTLALSGLLTAGTYTGDTSASDKLRVEGNIRATGTIYAQDFVLTAGAGSTVTGLYLDSLEDVVLGTQESGLAEADGQVLQRFNGKWRNRPFSAAGLSTSGSALPGKVPKFAGTVGNLTLTDSLISESGTTVTVGGSLSITGSVSAVANIAMTGALSGATSVSATTLTGTLSTVAQPNVTSLGTLTGLTVSAAITAPGMTTAGTLGLAATGANAITLSTNGTARWRVDSAGHLLAAADNTYDIGATAANRPRNVYASGTVYAQDFVLTGGAGGGITGLYLDSLEDVVIGTASGGIALATNHVLQWDGTYWRNKVLTASGLSTSGTTTAGTLTKFAGTAPNFTLTNSLISETGTAVSVGGNLGLGTASPEQRLDVRGRGLFVPSNNALGTYPFVQGAISDDRTFGVGLNLVVESASSNVYALGFSTTAGASKQLERWRISGAGHLLASADASYDIGAVGASRPRNVYVSGSITVGANAVLHAGNYTDYTVSKTGTGASGSWGISITGNAATATTAAALTTARAINGTAFNGSADITTATWGTARTLTIGNTGKSVNGSANVAWTLAEIGAAAAATSITINGTANQVTVTGGAQALDANRTWTIGLPASVAITTGLDVGTITGITAAALRVGGDIRASGTIYATDFVLTGGSGSGGTGLLLDSLDDVVITGPVTDGQILRYQTSTSKWVNVAPAFGSQLSVYDESTLLTANASSLRFVGQGVTATQSGSDITVSINTQSSLDPDLTAIAELTGTSGLLRKTAANTWSLDTATYVNSAGTGATGTWDISISGAAGNVPWWGISGARTLTRDNAGLRGDAGARSGFFETVSPVNYYPGASSWQHLIEARHTNDNNNYAMQLAGSFYDQALWFRKTADNPATPWRRIVTNDTDTTWSINTTGNSASATQLSSNRTFALTGDVTGSVSSNLSSGASIAATLANSGVTAGTYNFATITVDAKGRITAASTGTVGGVTSFNTRTGAVTLSSADVTTALTYTPPQPNGTGASGTWGIGITGNAATATALQTSRTIWGQSFNGGGNVTGALTGVTDITMSGALSASGAGAFSGRITAGTGSAATTHILSKQAHAFNSNTAHLELYADEGAASGEVSLRFHQGSRFWHQLRASADGLKLTNGADGTPVNFYAGTIYATDFVLTGGSGGGGTGLFLDSLDDVVITGTPTTGQILRYNGTTWSNSAQTLVGALTDLSDVTITGGGAGQYLRHNGTEFVNATLQTGDLGSGSPTTATFLRGDRTWSQVSATDLANADVNLATSTGWTAGNDSAVGYFGGGFAANGAAGENTRLYGTSADNTPYCSPGLVWAANNNETSSNDDGGWNKEITGLTSTKTYRSIVWVRRTSASTNGTFYHGCSFDTTLDLNGTQNTNPYFLSFGIADFTQSRWYLSVGYIHASNDSSTGSYGGLYDTVTGTRVKNYTDYKMAAGATRQLHRTYLYYSTDPTARLEWWGPRFEEVNGNEPSINSLLLGSPNNTVVLTNNNFSTYTAPLASPAFTGTPTAPTASAGTNTTQIATTAFVLANAAPVASPSFTGTPTAPTATAGTNTTQIATTAFVLANAAPIASPSFTGTPTAPTATAGTNTTQLATTAFVTTAVSATVPISRGGTGLTSVPLNGQLLIGNGTGFTLTNLSAGTGITITNSVGGITISSTATGGVTSFGGQTGAITLGSNLQMSGTQLQLSNVITTSNIGSQSVASATNASNVPWSGVSSKPTTISGYGITDGVTLSGAQTLSNKTVYDANYLVAGTRVETYAPSTQASAEGAIWVVYS